MAHLRTSSFSAVLALGASVVLLPAAPPAAAPRTLNGFNLDGALVDPAKILPGGPPRDGISALTDPATLPVPEVSYLREEDEVVGVVRGGEARAYPVRILVWHEIVNDAVGGDPLAVVDCPLCGSFTVVDRRAGKRTLEFGVSGLLYQSDVLLYDRQTESLWSQLAGKSVTGPLKGRRLRLLPFELSTWGDWKARHPEGRVLSADTGYARDYGRQPYGGYASSSDLYFPVDRFPPPRGFHPKTRVVGVEIGGVPKAYPFPELEAAGGTVLERRGGADFRVSCDAASGRVRVEDAAGAPLPFTVAFWFAWYNFHPDTEVFRAGGGP